jgi:NADPH:quinone reductase-like Zn-dependent oxidoreductase
MQAITQDSYGSQEALKIADLDKPEIGDGEVLVRVHAASVHVGDWILMTGSPFIMRMATGLRKPKNRVPGTDVAGTVEAVGAGVTRLQPGDEVFGWCTGAFAEYARGPEDQFLKKPANLTFEQASAIGVSASTALQLLRDNGKVQPGQKVLINGASGGVGTFAVQVAKAFGAEVTGVTSTKNVDLVRSIGADHVIDYTREDFTTGTERYDLILDNVGNHSMARTRRALTPRGTLISNGGGHEDGKLGRTVRAMLVSMFVRQQAAPTVKLQNHDDLVALKGLIEAGKVTPVIDRTYSLPETPAAIGLTLPPLLPSHHVVTTKKETVMSKATVTRLFIGSGIAIISGAILVIAAVWLAIANDVFVLSGQDVVGIRGGALAASLLGAGIVGALAVVGGMIGGLVSWIGALLNTWQLASRTWFAVLLLLGIFNLGFFAMVAYLVVGPDGTATAATQRTQAPSAA